MEEDKIQLCPVCIENPATHLTECNHKYCINCLSRITKCAMCRNTLQRSNLCSQIKNTNTNNLPTGRPSPELRIIPENYQPSGFTDFSRIYNGPQIRVDGTNVLVVIPENYPPRGIADFSNNAPQINVPNFNLLRQAFGMPAISISF